MHDRGIMFKGEGRHSHFYKMSKLRVIPVNYFKFNNLSVYSG